MLDDVGIELNMGVLIPCYSSDFKNKRLWSCNVCVIIVIVIVCKSIWVGVTWLNMGLVHVDIQIPKQSVSLMTITKQSLKEIRDTQYNEELNLLIRGSYKIWYLSSEPHIVALLLQQW
jgi:hypothetical protein